MKPHEIRLAQAEEFLRELGRGIPDDERVMVGYAEEATVQTDENGRKLNAGWWPVPWKEGKYINSRSTPTLASRHPSRRPTRRPARCDTGAARPLSATAWR
ncbi:hypothetical protein [Pseudomonas phage PA5]|uniref:Uncharacterized protein n=1 Tax=Pseudomonas phage PA5 TaxID=1913570 RepID=A0A1J0MHU6_9CAUD|nr:DNA primase [Pseudomonas phage PA5]APD20749.1 hypothetical protein [Pseudomonas phage PA5]